MATQLQNRAEQRTQDHSHNGTQQRITKGLGWFSIGLGLAEIVAPETIANLIGVSDRKRTRNTLRMYGLREVAAGIGILSQPNASAWLWARVAGDVVDLSTLGKAMTSRRTERAKAGAAAAAVLGITALDLHCAQRLSSQPEHNGQSRAETPQITQSITIDRSPEEIYGFWRDFNNLKRIFEPLESVEGTGANSSHWKLNTAAGRTIEWDSEITDDQPNSRIAWHSVSSTAKHSGSVHFERATGGRGTRVTVQIHLGGIGAKLGKFFGVVPEQLVNVALHNLKQILETGEVVKSDASIHRGMHPGQPPEQYRPQTESLHATA